MVNSLKTADALPHNLYLSLIRFRRLSENLLHQFSNSLPQKVLEAESSSTFVYFDWFPHPIAQYFAYKTQETS